MADDAYIRDSILQPKRDVVAGYEPIMPTFAGHASTTDEHPARSIAYIAQGHADHRAAGRAQSAMTPALTSGQHRDHPRRRRRDAGELPDGRGLGHTLALLAATTDHKRIAILYAVAITFFFFIGGAAATLIRLELVTPAGDLVIADTYNRLFTIHGVVMVWFFLIPSIPATLGNFLLPLMIGARDLAFPRLNLLSWYLYIAGGAADALRAARGRRRHRLDLLHAVLDDVLQHARARRGARRVRRRLLLDRHRPELHRHHPHAARARA